MLLNPPKIYTDIAIEQMQGNIDFFQDTLPAAFTDVKDTNLVTEFIRVNEAAMAELKNYQDWLRKDLLPRSHGTFAIGAENYRQKLLFDEMVDTPLPRLLEMGYAQLHKDQQAFADTARRIDPNKKPEDVLKEMERDHPTADKLLASAQQQLDGLRQFLIDNGESLHPDAIQFGPQVRLVHNRVRRVPHELDARQEPRTDGLVGVGHQHASHGRGGRRQAAAHREPDRQDAAGGRARDIDDLVAVEHGERA